MVRPMKSMGIRKFSQVYPSPRDETPVIYEIICEGEPPAVRFAIFGDGSHIVMGSSFSSLIGGAEFEMEDRNSNERLTLSLFSSTQVIIESDRSARSIPNFVTLYEDGLKFGQTRDALLQGVADAYTRKRREQVGAEQPATAPESKSERSEKPKPESEGRPQ